MHQCAQSYCWQSQHHTCSSSKEQDFSGKCWVSRQQVTCSANGAGMLHLPLLAADFPQPQPPSLPRLTFCKIFCLAGLGTRPCSGMAQASGSCEGMDERHERPNESMTFSHAMTPGHRLLFAAHNCFCLLAHMRQAGQAMPRPVTLLAVPLGQAMQVAALFAAVAVL